MYNSLPFYNFLFPKKEPSFVRFELIIPILLPPVYINTFFINIRSHFAVEIKYYKKVENKVRIEVEKEETVLKQSPFMFCMFIKSRLPFRVPKSHHDNAYHEHAITKGNGAFIGG